MDPAASIVDVEVDGDSDLVVAGQDYNKISRTLTKAGFAEGAVAGHDVGVKEGFPVGLASGVQCTIQWAMIIGYTRALIAICQRHGNESTPGKSPDLTLAEMKLNALLQEILTKEKQHKQSCLLADKTHYENTAGPVGTQGLYESCQLSKLLEGCCASVEMTDIRSRVDKLITEFRLM